MSYFGVPRLHFFGSFLAAPSTINNLDSNFDEPPVVHNLWNPKGKHYFQLLAGNEPTVPPKANVTPCSVTAIVTADGKFVTDPATDPLIGQLLVSTNNPTPAKLVDLDPDQQQVSQVWGMQLSLGPTGGALVADFVATNFQQLFPSRAPGGFGIGFSAAYQSQLVNLQWPSTIDSPLLKAWKYAGGSALSIRFTLDQLDVPKRFPGDPNFTIGRIAGTIGLAAAGEPQSITVGRLLRPVQPFAVRTATGIAKELLGGAPAAMDEINQNFNYAPALVDTKRNVVTIDLGNALPFETGGTPANAGNLEAAILTTNGAIILGPIANTLDNYRERAYLFELPLGDNADAGTSNPLVILSDGNVVLSENSSGAWIDADQQVYRLEAGATATTTLYATTFGATPAAGQTVSIASAALPNAETGVDWPAPTTALTATPATATITNGTATIDISAGTPGNPRGSIDGLVYGITFNWAEDTNPVQGLAVNVHVFDAFDVPASPTWSDVEPILQQFMILYPGMKEILDLSNEQTVNSNAKLIAEYLGFPISDSRHMPVTRDLSDPKRQMLLKYLAAQ